MGMHRWLLGPLICLILATTSARPPECKPPPTWSINGQQPLAETKASMLETLLKHFRSYGMDDVEFIIVNSKLSHSQDKLHELKKRVSFDVYQETDEEEVWDLMEGGKDDMFVYDRCGRLTYYIPFPLSILNESPLVSNAILATYFRSPCGVNCDQNKTVGLDDIVKNIEGDYETENVTGEENATYTETEQPFYGNETTNGTDFTNNLLEVALDDNDQLYTSNSNNTFNLTDYDYPTHDNNLQMNETNSTRVDNVESYFNSIYKLFFNSGMKDDQVTEIPPSNTSLNAASNDENNLLITTNNDTMTVPSASAHGHHHKHGHKETGNQEKKKSGRCLEADYEVCKSWSKKRLLHAQKCCSEVHSDPTGQDRRSCHNFGKKRCKKMQSILKCCIKTVYTEPVPAVSTDESTPQVPNVRSTTLTVESRTSTPTQSDTAVTETPDLVCCKRAGDGKICRVSYSGTCDEGEYIQQSPNAPM